jgi:hypothetical protein
MKCQTLVLVTVCLCVEWTRLTGVVKAINLRDSTVTLQNRDGDLLTVPVDYQVKIMEKHDEMRDLKHLNLDEKVTLTRIVADKPKEESDGLTPPEKR